MLPSNVLQKFASGKVRHTDCSHLYHRLRCQQVGTHHGTVFVLENIKQNQKLRGYRCNIVF